MNAPARHTVCANAMPSWFAWMVSAAAASPPIDQPTSTTPSGSSTRSRVNWTEVSRSARPPSAAEEFQSGATTPRPWLAISSASDRTEERASGCWPCQSRTVRWAGSPKISARRPAAYSTVCMRGGWSRAYLGGAGAGAGAGGGDEAGLLRRLTRIGHGGVVLLPRLAAVRLERLVGRLDPHNLRLLAHRVVERLLRVVAEPFPIADAVADRTGRGINTRHDVGANVVDAVFVDRRLGRSGRRSVTGCRRGSGGRRGCRGRRRRCRVGDGKAGRCNPPQYCQRRCRSDGRLIRHE